MFGFLKEKLGQFTDKIKQTLQAKPVTSEPAQPVEEKIVPTVKEEIKVTLPTVEEKSTEKEVLVSEKKEIIEENIVPPVKKVVAAKVVQEEIKEPIKAKPVEVQVPVIAPAGQSGLKEMDSTEKREIKAKAGLFTQVKNFFSSDILVEEGDIRDFLFELELALLESDVEQKTATAIVNNLEKELVGKRAPKSEGLDAFLKKEIRLSLAKVMTVPGIDFWKRIEQEKPFIILVLGPNGAGKTTSIAKLTYLLQQHGKKVVWGSADTFRSGAIEQLETHAERLNVKLVKHDYGADPAAVAFDAVKAGQSLKADVVLIDTAGRQDTNSNLMRELEKMNRVVKPHLKIYVGEAFTGQALLTQATEFNQIIGIDGFILSKMDTDAKGGTCISVLHQLQKPVLFVGVGQQYPDLVDFKPEFILDRIL